MRNPIFNASYSLRRDYQDPKELGAFEEELELIGPECRGKTIVWYFKDAVTNQEYPFFSDGMLELLKTRKIEYGKVEKSSYEFCRKTRNYAIRLLKRD